MIWKNLKIDLKLKKGIKMKCLQCKTRAAIDKTGMVHCIRCFEQITGVTFNELEDLLGKELHNYHQVNEDVALKSLKSANDAIKKKTKTYTFWVNVYKDHFGKAWDTQEDADIAHEAIVYERLGPAEKITIEREVEGE